MATFKIKKTTKVVFGCDDPKGVTMDGKTAITDDAAWVKELRKLPKASAEEVVEPEAE